MTDLNSFKARIRRWFRIPYGLSIRYKRTKRPFQTTYVLLHGIADTGEMWRPLIAKLPKDSNYIVVDLLGHGASPYPPGDSVYSAFEQARNVMVTCLRAGLSGPVVVIGHSFGGLVATEFAYRYKGLVRQLILVSPPIYRDENMEGKARLQQETLLRTIYTQLLTQPDIVIKGYALADRLKLAGFSKLQLDGNNFVAFAGTLRSGIMSQRVGKHLLKTKIPTHIIYGRFDPVLVPVNFTALAKHNPNISVKAVVNDHSLRPIMVKEILTVLADRNSTKSLQV